MRFYGWTWEQLMSTPIFGFWTCYRQMNRLKAQETLDKFRVEAVSNAEAGDRKAFVADLLSTIGTVVKRKVTPEKGINRLKDLSRVA